MATAELSDLRSELQSLRDAANAFFTSAQTECATGGMIDDDDLWSIFQDTDHFWNMLSQETKDEAALLTERLLRCTSPIAMSARSSPLTGAEDVQAVKEATKVMRAALRLRRYSYREADVIHDEDRVLGFRPAEQSEKHGATPGAAQKAFAEGVEKIEDVLALIEAGSDFDPSVLPSGIAVPPSRYRAGTAFILMWMDPRQPELTDVADTVKAVFGGFGIKAVRADDIEHEGLISPRVLSEIETSEFLFADLTGARPNVYYEVGYAHALGKRVILFRKSGTDIHFDLAGYNCPDYKNLRDLRDKLTKRLVALTNRQPLVAEVTPDEPTA